MIENLPIFQKGGICLKLRLVCLTLCCVLMAAFFVMPASAESAASSVETFVTVNSDGDCMVSLSLRLRLETPVESLTFPVPANATDISVNGGGARTTKSASAIDVDISRVVGGMTGEMNVTLGYNIPKAVTPQKAATGSGYYLQLDIPMLCGFSYPVEQMKFVITLPDNIKYMPTFSSIYQQTSIESSLTYYVDQKMITGSTTKALNDHEGLTMSMVVPKEMFPSVKTHIREGNPELTPMLAVAGAGLVYWLLFLHTLPLIRTRSVTPPEGITAGEMGCQLTLAGADLTMMIFHWAQLGYVILQLDGGRVTVHKRMEMGNERSPFEVKVYKMLFGSRRVVDATGSGYEKLSRKVFAMIPGERNLCKSGSGSVKIFRAIFCVAQAICGVCVAMNFTTSSILQVLLSIILVLVGIVTAWLIQEIAFRTHLRGKTRVFIGLSCIVLWMVLGLLCGQFWIPAGAALAQWAVSYLAAYGGRRTEIGRLNASRILGLRSYLKHLPKGDINRLLLTDPDYFFNMAPFALSLGVIHPFARSFGSRKFDQCPYLVTRVHGKRTATEWAELLADTADLMDERFRRMEIQRLTRGRR